MRADSSIRQWGGSLVWLLILYIGLTYLAVGTISVSQINSRFGDQASYIFHLADIADQQRKIRQGQLRTVETSLDEAMQQREFSLIALNSQAQHLGLSLVALRAALENQQASVRLQDLGMQADADTSHAWDANVTAYYRGVLMEELATKRREHILDELRGGLARLVGDSSANGKVIGTITETQFQNATSTASGLRSFGYAWLFAIPSEVLTLVLALVLGALGSALHMTKVALDPAENPSPAWYIIRPCQGVLMALVVFVLLKAGQLTMAAGDSDALNPFFVAFVGVVSGLLSPDAYRLIQRAGSSIIPASTEEGARWAFGLAAAMREANVDVATLAEGIGAEKEIFDTWVAETVPVPVREQALIAAWLHGDARTLFTADPPPMVLKLAASSAAEAAAVPA
ncbi:MAG: hypothetical protein H7Y60_10060 [Rhodospirillaceae bacterium]|nr:hypothetical protein [Rhodospirillales bacterium]